MRHFGRPIAAVVASGLMLGVTSACAQTHGTTSACAKEYKEFWQNFDRFRFAKMAAERIVDLSRKAIRAYDACEAGDEQGAKALYARLASPDEETGPGPFNPNLPR